MRRIEGVKKTERNLSPDADPSRTIRRGHGVVAVTSSTTTGGVGPFETPFQIGAAALSAILVVVAVVLGWTGYQGGELVLVGTELNMIGAVAGVMIAGVFAAISLVAALYMESGFDD